MKKLVYCLWIFFITNYALALAFAPPQQAPSQDNHAEQHCSDVSISIEKIVPNDYIQGRVDNLSADKFDQYKIVIYVKTDRWYIHPYDRGGANFSYAKIGISGIWKINTEKRKFLANTVAALLVENSLNTPNKIDDIENINYCAIYREPGRGRL